MTTKAIRATIKLGSIELDCYQMPDGEYTYGTQYLASLIDKDKSILSDKKSPYLLESLLGGDKTSWNVKIEGIGYTYKTISQTQFGKALGSLARLGHATAIAILEATFEEALERRADAAFGVVRTEQERNDKLINRLIGKEWRRSLTDAIQAYVKKHPELSENYAKFVYSNCSDHLNLVVLGMRAKQVRLELDLKPSEPIRDHVQSAALKELASVEEFACRIIEHEDLEPLEAVKKAIALHYTKTIGL